MYQQIKPPFEGAEAQCIKRLADTAFIPFCPDNTDYQQFKIDVEAGAELLDAEGNVMNTEQIKEIVSTLP